MKNRLVELTSRHRQEVELEGERAKQSQSQLEKTQMARERAHKQRVKGLEEQVSRKSRRAMFQAGLVKHSVWYNVGFV